jgi:Calx-beta domain
MRTMVRSAVVCAVAFLAVALTIPVSAVVLHPKATAAVAPSVSVSDASVSEGTGGTVTAVFTITQDKRGRSRISFATHNDTATSPADYVARSGFVRFAGNKLTKNVAVTVIGDALDEDDETLFLEITDAVGATIADGEGVGTIVDDDAPPVVSIDATTSVPEGQTGDTPFASIHVTLSAESGRAVAVHWATADGTATSAGLDYSPGSDTLEFTPGQTKLIVLIPVIGDEIMEGDETFDVNVSSPVNATLGNATDIVTIVDNDPIPPGSAVLTVTGAKKREGASGTTTLTFTVTRTGETTTAVDVNYVTGDATAIAPSDYAFATGNLAFLANQTLATVDVIVNGDRALEHNEALFLSLLDPSVGAAVSTGQATGTIANDDTKTTVAVKVRVGKGIVAVHGRVSPPRRGKHVVVRLLRRHNGVWVRIARTRARLRGAVDLNGDGFADSRYATSLKRAKPGRCRIVTTYPGDARFSGSSRGKLFRC